MKKLILSLTIGLVGMTTYAQTSRYELGFNIGPNLNGYRGTAFDDVYYDPFLVSYETEKVLGTSYGLSLQYNFGDLKKSKVISEEMNKMKNLKQQKKESNKTLRNSSSKNCICSSPFKSYK